MNAIDALDQHILDVLLADSRISLKQLAEQVGLSSPSVSEHPRRPEGCGVIRHYAIDVDPASPGYTLRAIARVRPTPDKLHIVQQLIEEVPEIDECGKVTGEDCFIARLYVRSIDQFDETLDRVAYHAGTNTVTVKTQSVKRCAPPFVPTD